MEEESLAKVLESTRRVNSKLMKTNLGLLMSIREADCKIQRAKKELFRYQEALMEKGIELPQSCMVQNDGKKPQGKNEEHDTNGYGNDTIEDDQDNESDDRDSDSSTDSSSDD